MHGRPEDLGFLCMADLQNPTNSGPFVHDKTKNSANSGIFLGMANWEMLQVLGFLSWQA